jgi:hypothetical protein
LLSPACLLSTICNAGIIYAFDYGEIPESGTRNNIEIPFPFAFTQTALAEKCHFSAGIFFERCLIPPPFT